MEYDHPQGHSESASRCPPPAHADRYSTALYGKNVEGARPKPRPASRRPVSVVPVERDEYISEAIFPKKRCFSAPDLRFSHCGQKKRDTEGFLRRHRRREMVSIMSGSTASAATSFVLHPRLAGDTVTVGDLPLCRLLLMRNALFPWLILVPRRPDAVEIHRLAPADQAMLMGEITRTSEVLETLTTPDKINVGALGNLVPQLHVHVIARRRDDPAWPGPVWGSGHHADYGPGALEALVDRVRAALELPC